MMRLFVFWLVGYVLFPLTSSECSSFLPLQRCSMQFRVAVELPQNCDQCSPSPPPSSSSLSLFQAVSSPNEDGAIFFTGGPVWAMDWLSRSESHHQFVAVASYRELDEVSCDTPTSNPPISNRGSLYSLSRHTH